jgi:TPR repeat protein
LPRLVIFFAILVLVLLAPTSGRAGPFDDGVLAFDQARYSVAKELFEGLVESGHAGAEAMLGIMYFNGQGVVQDRFIAAIYFYKSARRGNANAQLALGSLYIQGIGVRANTATAYKWVSLAEKSAAGQLAAAAKQLKESLGAGLSAEERLATEAKIAEWKPVRSNN